MVAANQEQSALVLAQLRDHVAAVQRAPTPSPDCLVRPAIADALTSALVPLLPSPSYTLSLIYSAWWIRSSW